MSIFYILYPQLVTKRELSTLVKIEYSFLLIQVEETDSHSTISIAESRLRLRIEIRLD